MNATTIETVTSATQVGKSNKYMETTIVKPAAESAIPATTSAPINLTSSTDSLGKALANPASPTEAAPTPGVILSYPDWPEVIDSLLDAFARLHMAGWPAQGASATIAPTDDSPPAPATLTDMDAFLLGIASRERPDVSCMDHSLNGLLQAVMTLHVRAVLQHNRQVRMDGLTQDLPVAK